MRHIFGHIYFLLLILLTCLIFISDARVSSCEENGLNCPRENIPVRNVPSWLAVAPHSQEQEITNLTTSAKWMTPSGEMVDIVMGHGNGITILTSFGSDPVNFYLHTKNHPNGVIIKVGNETNLDKFMPGKETKFICHGFWSDITTNGTLGPMLSAAYLETQIEDANLILVDWSKPASTIFYWRAVAYTKIVAGHVAHLIETLIQANLITPKKIHFIGHSLGAHIGGLVNNYLKPKNISRIGRISGLDPAGPNFEHRGSLDGLHCDLVPPQDRLSIDDADFVDIVHTDLTKWGVKCPIGDVDYYPNGGRRQPACFILSPTCSHSMSYWYFKESIRNPFGFFGCRCEENDIKKCECKQNARVIMGAFGKRNTRTSPGPKMGIVYFQTRAKEPYGCERSFSCNTCPSVSGRVMSAERLLDRDNTNKTMSDKQIGNETSTSWVPWIVTLSHPMARGLSTHFCSGVLIESNVILTAAHCVNGTTAKLMVITAGRQVTDKDAGTEQNRSVWFWQIHPFFYKGSYGKWYNDIALIYTQTPFEIGPMVGLATLEYDGNYMSNSSRILAAWRKIGDGGDRKLKSVKHPTLPVSVAQKFDLNMDNCTAFYNTTQAPSWVCGTGLQNLREKSRQRNVDCGADAGAPLHVEDGHVVGIVSFGGPQCNSHTVFTNLEWYRDWIETGRRLCVDSIL